MLEPEKRDGVTHSARRRHGAVWSRLAAATILVLFSFLAAWLGRLRTADPVYMAKEACPLTVEDDTLDFGTQWPQPAYEHALIVRNVTTRRVEIVDVQASCGCVISAPTSRSVSPGQCAEIPLRFDLHPAKIGRDAGPTTDYAFNIAVVYRAADDAAQSANLGVARCKLKGRVRHLLKLSDTTIAYLGHRRLRYGLEHPTTCVQVQPLVVLDDLKATCVPDCADIEVRRAAGGTYNLMIRPHRDLQPGPFEFVVYLDAIADHLHVQGGFLRVRGLVDDDIQADPAVVCLGSGEIGTELAKTVCLTSASHVPFEIQSIDCDDYCKVLELRTFASDVRRVFRVAARVSRPGAQQSVVRFQLKQPSNRIRWKKIVASYFGIDPRHFHPARGP